MRLANILALALGGVILFLVACAAPVLKRTVGVAPTLEPASPLGQMVAEPQPAAFTTSDLALSTAECNFGGEVWVSVTVTNTGGQRGTYPVVVKINGVAARTGDVTLAAGASQKVYFVLNQKDDLPEFFSYKISVDKLERDVLIN